MKRAALQFGFTIVELLVTIVVVGILAAIVTVTYNGTQAQSRDKQRVADMEIIVNALEKYKSQHGEYPEEQSMPSSLDGSGWELSNRPAGFLSELKNSGILKDVPIEADAKNVGGSPSRDSTNYVYFYYLYPAGGFSGTTCDPSRGKYYILGMTRMESVPIGQNSPDSPGSSCKSGASWTSRSFDDHGAWVTIGFTN